MRQAGIPTSQQPVSQVRTRAGYQYEYNVDGQTKIVLTRPRIECPDMDPTGRLEPPRRVSRRDPLGRIRVTNNKAKVSYGE